ncbi:MAG: hypothetical protein ACF8Q5_11825 [Phycisphaerales bacterium JB040]
MNRPPTRRTPARAIFWLATLALLTATHWPGLAVDGPIDRSDLVVHAIVFAVWTGLLAGAYAPPARVLIPLALGFAVFDETTQPLFDRTFDRLDLAADAAGVLVASCIVLSVRHLRRDAGSNPVR